MKWCTKYVFKTENFNGLFFIIIKIREFFLNKTTAFAIDSIRTSEQKRLVCTCTGFFSLSFEGWEMFKSQWCKWIMGYSAQVMGGGICLYFLCTKNAIFFLILLFILLSRTNKIFLLQIFEKRQIPHTYICSLVRVNNFSRFF